MRYNWREIPRDIGRALFFALFFFGILNAAKLADFIIAESQDCASDTECMARYGGDGGPEPAANTFVCIHKQNQYPCINP